MQLTLLNSLDMSNTPVEGENLVSLTALCFNLQESRDSDSNSIKLFEDKSKEVDDMQLAYDNLFEKFSGLNKKVFKKLKEIVYEKEKLVANLKNSCAICDALQLENVMLIIRIKYFANELNETNEHLNKLLSDRLTNLLGVQKSSMSNDNFGASTSPDYTSTKKTMFVKPVRIEGGKVYVACWIREKLYICIIV
jgi:hypothetical protein